MSNTAYVGLYDDAGSKNAFYLVKDRKKIGFKEFENEREAKFAHKIQKVLAEKNLAPRVYGEVGMIRRHDGELTSYGYLTEVARTMRDCNDNDCDGECYESGCKNSEMIAEVVESLEWEGLHYNDHHRGNFGFVRRGNQWIPVVIDVGVESFGDWNSNVYGQFEYEDYDCCSCTVCQVIRKKDNG
ncbi:MAG: hypothetical protein ACKODS_04495 [Methylophilaceae bacterium]